MENSFPPSGSVTFPPEADLDVKERLPDRDINHLQLSLGSSLSFPRSFWQEKEIHSPSDKK